MDRIFLLFWLFLCRADYSLIFFTSNSTSASDKKMLEGEIEGILKSISQDLKFSDSIKTRIHNIEGTEEDFAVLDSVNQGVLLDFTNQREVSQEIAEESYKRNMLNIVLNRPIDTSSGEFPLPTTLFSHLSYTQEANLLFSIVQYFNWTNLAIVHDQNPNNVQMSNYIRSLTKSPKAILSEQIFTEADSYEDIKSRLFTNVKNTKGRVIFLLANPSLATTIIRAGQEIAIAGTGYVWLLNSDTLQDLGEILHNTFEPFGTPVMRSGIVGILPLNSERIQNDRCLVLSSLIASVLLKWVSSPFANGQDLANYFMAGVSLNSNYISLKFDSGGMRVDDFGLINMQNYYDVQVGSWVNGQVSIKTSIIWPGYGTAVPSDEYITVYLVLLQPLPSNSETVPITNSFNLAIKLINEKNTIPGYVIQPIIINTYSSSDMIQSSLSFISNLNVIGLVGPWGEDVSKLYIDYFAEAKNPKPLISYESSSYVLNNSKTYPYFLRTTQPDGLSSTALISFLALMKWKNIGVIYTDDYAGVGTYMSFIQNIQSYDIIIKNPEDKRAIKKVINSGLVSQTTIDSIKEALSEIIRNQLKVVLFLGNSEITPSLIQVIHEKQLYGEEYFWIGSSWLTEEVLLSLNSDQLKVVQGFMSLGPRSPQGSQGQEFEKSYIQLFNSSYTYYSMLSYDSVNLYGYALSRIIESGEDFYNLKTMMTFLRTSDFEAVSGTLKFSEGYNDRVMTGYSLTNVQNKSLVRIMTYDPLSYYITENGTTLQWPGGISNATSDSWPEAFSCPFPKSMSVISYDGFVVIIVIGVGLVIISIVLSLFNHKKSNFSIYGYINQNKYKTWKDTLVEIMIGVEFFQFLAIAPAFKSLDLLVVVFSNVFMLDVLKIAKAQSNYYWFMLSGVCSLCFLWFVTLVLVISRKIKYFNKFLLLKRLMGLLTSFFLPFFGNTLFLPVLTFLLDAFVCDHQVLGRAYVFRDCYMTCWTPTHIQYVVLSAFAIIFYQPLALFCRPHWQDASQDIHLKTKTTFTLVKTCFQMLLITIGKSLQGNFPLAHGITFTLLVLVFSFATYKFKAFNYDRCNLWELISLLGLFYYSLLATLSFSGNEENVGWVITLLIGWVVLLLAGYFVQVKYFPSYLLTEDYLHDNAKVDQGEKIHSLSEHAEEGNKVIPVSKEIEDESKINQITKIIQGKEVKFTFS